MYFDRFDIVEAYYLFLGDYHEGQFSEKYERLCRMSKYFKPAPGLHYDSLSENGQAWYDGLVAKEAYKDSVKAALSANTVYYAHSH